MNVVSLTQQTSHGVISEQTPAAFRRTPKGRRQAESRLSCMALYNRQQVTFIRNGMTRVSFRIPPANRARSRTLQKLPTSQTDKKLPPCPRHSTKANQIIASKMAGTWGNFGEDEGGLEGEGTPSEKGSLLPPRSSPFFLKKP